MLTPNEADKLKEEIRDLMQQDYEHYCHRGLSALAENTWEDIIATIDKYVKERG